MKIDIQTQYRHLDAELEHFVGSRVNFALGMLGDRVQAVRVALVDENNADSDAGQRCRVSVSLPGKPDIEVENFDPNIYIAIHRAVDRAGREASRRLELERRRTRISGLTARPVIEHREQGRVA